MCRPSGRGDADKPGNEQIHGFVQDHAKAQSKDQRDGPADEQFEEQHQSDVLFCQSQDVEQTEFPLALFHEKAVGVEEKDHGEQHDDELPEAQHHLQLCPAVAVCHRRSVFQADDQIQHQGAEGAGENEGNRGAAVALQIRYREFCCKLHAGSPFLDMSVSVRLMSSYSSLLERSPL